MESTEDLKRFKALTMGHAVIMGRKTWDSLPFKPLPDRLNTVVKSGCHAYIGDRLYAGHLQHALNHAAVRQHEQVFIIGGEQLYRESLPLADRVYLTLVNQETPIADGDEVARFPVDELRDMLIFDIFAENGYRDNGEYEFIDYVKKGLIPAF